MHLGSGKPSLAVRQRFVTTALVLGPLAIGLGFVGPFGTFGVYPLAERIAYWTVSLGLAAATWTGMLTLGRRLWPRRKEGAVLPWLVGPPYAVVGATETALLHVAFGWSNAHAAVSMWPAYLVGWLVTTLLVVLPIFTVVGAAARRATRAAVAASADRPSPMAAPLDPSEDRLTAGGAGGNLPADILLARSARVGRLENIVALEAQDHYVKVHSRRGVDLVLMRFEDALAAVALVPGARIHRSWWVAAAAVEAVLPDRVRLAGGVEAPISRRRRRQAADSLGRGAGRERAPHAE